MHSRAVYWDSMDEALECQPTMWSVPDKTWLGSNLGDLWASRKALGEALIGTKTMSWHTPVATNLQFGRESSLKQCSGPLWITCQSCRSAVFTRLWWTSWTERWPQLRQLGSACHTLGRMIKAAVALKSAIYQNRIRWSFRWMYVQLKGPCGMHSDCRTKQVQWLWFVLFQWELWRVDENCMFVDVQRDEACRRCFIERLSSRRNVHLVEWQTTLLRQHECDWIGLICQPVSPLTSNQLVQFRQIYSLGYRQFYRVGS